MKKKYSIVCLVSFIACIVLFPVASRSQDLTDEQKQEKCQNNVNRIAELETELRMITAELSQTMEKKEIADAGKKVDVIKLAAKNMGLVGINEIKTIAAQYNYNFEDCEKRDVVMGISLCLSELEDLIVKKIEKAVSLEKKRPALINKKKEIEKDLASHKNNLIFWGCKDFDYSKLTGEWVRNSGGPPQSMHFMQLNVSEGIISGGWNMPGKVAKITGGSFDPIYKKLSLTFLQEWSQKKGKIEFRFFENSANYILQGPWSYDDGSPSDSEWTMMKKKY